MSPFCGAGISKKEWVTKTLCRYSTVFPRWRIEMLGQSVDNAWYQEQYHLIHIKALGFPVQDSVWLFSEEEGKDFVRISNKVHVQKLLLLSNLKELCVAWKERYPDHKIGLSKFCELLSKWYVTVSSCGAHFVCVCTHHQITKLLVDYFCSVVKTQLKRKAEEPEDKNEEVPKFDITYKGLMAMVVCDTTNLESMVHRCKNCSGFPALEKFIRNKFKELTIDEEMSYNHGESVDRKTLWTHTAYVGDFIELLVYSVDKLTTHSFIAKSQAQHLK